MKQRKIGCMSCKVFEEDDKLEFGFSFSTESMGIGYTHSKTNDFHVNIERLTQDKIDTNITTTNTTQKQNTQFTNNSIMSSSSNICNIKVIPISL